MAPIQYPNGKKPSSALSSPASKNKVSYGNRGMTLEEDLNKSNEFYLERGIAVIHKKPTPVQIVNVEYPKRSAAVIKEAYFKLASTTDYNGIYQGKYIDFEAKETKNKTSFPLRNFHEHQIRHMEAIIAHGGIAFIILRFSTLNEIYLLDAGHLIPYWNDQTNGRKSIPKKEIESLGHPISPGFLPRIDYLKIIDKMYFHNEDEGKVHK
ncbi:MULTISPECIES: Holliday junction resolvase RecU [Fictibacillus]|uniref:Holliday junction resolvase RecU n=1 Tax=Fictibacillus enclensis TaxID=1017270 RepID=A0A0V8JEU7_9BACL|nr:MULTISPECIES: Holliday junction resolvase RecU [Fictibacillus]KSU85547.1 Holliday junction resolvase [Fictibacillus enclensis]RXY98763.1 Holliday junction resolvase RecU [Fictibacillus sp. S7]SCB98616.1 recombination protein U [Fictibacillus enclensis]